MLLENPKKMTTSQKFNPRWISWFLLVSLFSTACWFLSQWQFDRQAEVQIANSIIDRNYYAEPVALEEVITTSATWSPQFEFKQVVVSGKYLASEQYLIRNRPYEANPGFLHLVAFETDGGNFIWVERGWLPTGSLSDSPDEIPEIDQAHRQLVLRLRPSEAKLERTAPPGQLPSIDLPSASNNLPRSETYNQTYGRLVLENPEGPRGLELPKPDLNEGNHLSYAFQWLLFALMAFGAVFWTIAQERRRAAGKAPRKLAILNRDRDAEAEDELLS